MVLSNKKKKLMLRAARAGLLTAYPGESGDSNRRDSNSLSMFTVQDSEKVNLSKREKRRQQAQHENLDGSKSKVIRDDDADREPKSDFGEKENILEWDGVKVKINTKRKRDDSKAQQDNFDGIKNNGINDDAEERKTDELKLDIGEDEGEPNPDSAELKKKKKKKGDDSKVSENVKEKAVSLKKKKKKPKKKKKKAKKNVENGLVKEGGEQNGSKPTGERLLATLDESGMRSEVAEVVPDKVYVGGIPYYSTEDDIRSYFEHCGTITDIDCMTFSDTGKFRGIAILSFKTEAAAKRALALDGSDMGGLFLKIQPYKSAKVIRTTNFAPSAMEGYNRIYVGNLSWDITEDDLKNLFSGCNISSIRWGLGKETAEFKGYGHVDFADSESLDKALKLDQTVLYGRPVKISYAVPKKGAVSNFNSTPKGKQFESVKFRPFKSRPVTEEVRFIQKDNQVHIVDVTPVTDVQRSIQRDNQANTVKVSEDAITSARLGIQSEVAKNSAVSEDRANSSAATPVSSKIRRRTCYQCGEKGHLSSACPNTVKVSEDAITSTLLGIQSEVAKISAVSEDRVNGSGIQSEVAKISVVSEDRANSSVATPVSSKIRRRTCYECGEKGHLSSACPNKPAADSANPEAK